MPQMDLYSYTTQIFWILIGFNFFYFFILKYYIAEIFEIFKLRKKLLKLRADYAAFLSKDSDSKNSKAWKANLFFSLLYKKK